MKLLDALFFFVILALTPLTLVPVTAVDDLPVVTDDKVYFMVKKDEKSQPKHLSLYVLNDLTDVKVTSTRLIDDNTKNILGPSSLTFNVTTLDLQNNTIEAIAVSALANERGKFEGRILLLGNDGSASEIPVTIDTGVYYELAIPLIIVGFLISLVAWNIAPPVNLFMRFKNIKEDLRRLDLDLTWYSGIVKEDAYKSHIAVMIYELSALMKKMNCSLVDEAETCHTRIRDSYSEMICPDNMDMNRIKFLPKDRDMTVDKWVGGLIDELKVFEKLTSNEKIEVQGPLHSFTKDTKKDTFKFRILDYVKGNKKAIMVNLLTIGIGVVVSMSVILQGDYLNALRVIHGWEVFILMGIGAGTDTVKQLVAEFTGSKKSE